MFEYVEPCSIYPKPTIINNISINGGLSKPTIDTNVIEAGWAQKSPNMFSLATFSLKDQHLPMNIGKLTNANETSPVPPLKSFASIDWKQTLFLFFAGDWKQTLLV